MICSPNVISVATVMCQEAAEYCDFSASESCFQRLARTLLMAPNCCRSTTETF